MRFESIELYTHALRRGGLCLFTGSRKSSGRSVWYPLTHHSRKFFISISVRLYTVVTLPAPCPNLYDQKENVQILIVRSLIGRSIARLNLS